MKSTTNRVGFLSCSGVMRVPSTRINGVAQAHPIAMKSYNSIVTPGPPQSFCFGTQYATMLSFHSEGVGISTNSIVPGPHLFKGFIHKLGRNSNRLTKSWYSR